MDHTESIMHLQNIINDHFLEKIIPLIDNKAKKHLGVRTEVDTSIRNVKGHHLQLEKPTDIFYYFKIYCSHATILYLVPFVIG